MTFARFKARTRISRRDFCLEMLDGHGGSIKPKKAKVALKNLDLILTATLKLGNQKGFRAMTMRDLSQASGLSVGALYDHFSGKDELLEMIQAAGRRITGRILKGSLDRQGDPARNLAGVIRSHVFLSEIMRDWFFFSYMEARHLGDEEKKKAVSSELFTEKLLAGIIRRGNRQGVFSAADPDLTAALIKAMVQDWYLKRWKYAKRRVSVTAFAGRVVEAARLMCQAGPSGQKGLGELP